MLAALSIRDVVLIDRLDLAFDAGLCVLTGETGAGKSILLDSLGLALGQRADSALVRRGAERAAVTATFELPARHPARALLADHGLGDDGPVILRRVLAADGGSRGYVNDQAATIGLMKQIGDTLVEVQGQFEQRGLLDAATHRALLDAFAGLGDDARGVRRAWEGWQAAADAERRAAEDHDKAKTEEDFLRHAVAELDALDPREGEEDRLAETRSMMMNREKLVAGLNAALAEIAGDGDVEGRLQRALAAIERIAKHAGGRLDAARQALERAVAESAEAAAQLEAAGADIEVDDSRLEDIEERLFTLRDVARKHRVEVAALPALRADLARRLDLLSDQGDARARLAQATRAARQAYVAAAEALSKARAKAAKKLEKAVAAELPPLKLDKARFAVAVTRRADGDWRASGLDRIAFLVATNPGAEPGPLARIASGGELSRLMLALRVVLSATGSAPSLVFDEVDSGVGGATAAAVGDRLARLAEGFQVLVVTHSPQVAARGGQHLRVEKVEAGGDALTRVAPLEAGQRREEIARMLAGRTVTDEARRAADSLLAGDAA